MTVILIVLGIIVVLCVLAWRMDRKGGKRLDSDALRRNLGKTQGDVASYQPPPGPSTDFGGGGGSS